MKTQFILLVFITLFSLTNLKAQEPSYVSVKSFQGTVIPFASGYNIKNTLADANGNIYSLGYAYGGQVQFGALSIDGTVPNTFIVKFNNQGDAIWIKKIILGGDFTGYGFNMNLDGIGNIIISGDLPAYEQLSFTDVTFETSHNKRSYIIKYSSSNGELMWHHFFGTDELYPDLANISSSIIPSNQFDASGNTTFLYSCDAPSYSVGTTIYNSVLDSSGSAYYYYVGYVVVTINNQGVIVSTIKLEDESTNKCFPQKLTIDQSGNFYLLGKTFGAFGTQEDFNFYNFILPSYAMFVAKFDATGNIIWATSASCININPVSLSVNEDEEVFVEADIYGTCDFGGGQIYTNPNTNGIYQKFILKYDASFNILWIKNNISAKIFTPDIDGGIVYVGKTSNSITFTKLNIAGNLVWTGTSLSTLIYPTNIILRNNNNVIVSGYFSSASITIDTTTLANILTYLSNNFIVEIGSVNPIYWTGNTSTNWNAPTNWDPQQIPTLIDDIIIPSGRPHYPKIVASNDVECRKMTIEDGATLTMNAGILSVWGEITAPNADVFSLPGGTLKLFHGTIFPDDMKFNNLTITNFSNIEEDNIYEIPGFSEVNGQFKMTGTITEPNLPKVRLVIDDYMKIYKDFILEKGNMGILFGDSLPDGMDIPSVVFTGTGTQNIKLQNDPFGDGKLNATVIIDNPAARFTNLNTNWIYNLILGSDFDLDGKTLFMYGKIGYLGGITSPYTILNSKPNKGTLIIGNTSYSVNNQPSILKCEKLKAIRFGGYGDNSNDTLILVTNIALDTLRVFGYLNLNGKDLTVGTVTTQKGFFQVDSLNTTINTGTLTLNPSSTGAAYQINAWNLNNLTINNAGGAQLMNATNFGPSSIATIGLGVYGTIRLREGNLDLNGNDIFLKKHNSSGINKGKVIETPGNVIVNLAQDLKEVSIDKIEGAPCNNKDFGGLGFIVTTSSPLQEISVLRYLGTAISDPQAELFAGIIDGVDRFYGIYNHNISGLNAQISIRYDESELNGVSEGDLGIFRRNFLDPIGEWEEIPSSVNTSTNTVTSSTLLSQIDTSPASDEVFTFYTLASVSSMQRKEEKPFTQSMDHSLLIYPNPTTHTLNIRNLSDKPRTYQVFDVTGKLILTQTLNTTQVSMDVSILPSGMYVLQIVSEDQLTQQKFIKQ